MRVDTLALPKPCGSAAASIIRWPSWRLARVSPEFMIQGGLNGQTSGTNSTEALEGY
jgi:hypothetical protein